MRLSRRWLALLLSVAFPPLLHAQEVHTPPGKYDYYLLNLSWAPEFCHNVEVLPANEHTADRRADAAGECGTPHGFVLHGLWPQNYDGTYPVSCGDRPGLADYRPYLQVTPSLTLLAHEWRKHGTCTTLSPDGFFATARRAYESIKIPPAIEHNDRQITLTPDDILGRFYASNPSYPQGSLVLSCGRNYLTAIEACLDRNTLKPIACQNLRSCRANVVKIAPERPGAVN